MKIAQISATFPPYMAGTGIVCFHNSLELAKLGHDVTVFTSGSSNDDCVHSQHLKVERMKSLFNIGNAPFIPQLITLNKFDLIHLHYPYYFGGEIIYLLHKLKSLKYVVTYHNDVPEKGVLSPLFKLHRRLIMNKIMRDAEYIFVPTMGFAENSFVCDYLKNNSNKIIEIPNGVDIVKFNPQVKPLEISGVNKSEVNIILFIRALDKAHYHNGLEYLIEYMKEYSSENELLIVVGDGNLKEYYQNMSVSMGVEDKVIFLGNIPHETIPPLYALSDVVVLPSTTTESFGMVLIEAMASGKPVIASDLPGIRSVVDDGINGLLFKPMDTYDLNLKLRYLLDNVSIRESMGLSGRKKAIQKYGWDKIALKLESLYTEIIS